jgi:hypothetical protein
MGNLPSNLSSVLTRISAHASLSTESLLDPPGHGICPTTVHAGMPQLLLNSAFQHKDLFSSSRIVCEVAGTSSKVCDTVAEWLRRSTRNRLGLSRVGSSPASVDIFLLFLLALFQLLALPFHNIFIWRPLPFVFCHCNIIPRSGDTSHLLSIDYKKQNAFLQHIFLPGDLCRHCCRDL